MKVIMAECFKNSLWLLAIMDIVHVGISFGAFPAKYRTRNNCRIKPDLSLQNIWSNNFINCILSCKAVTGCVSISWQSVSKRCRLSVYDLSIESWIYSYRPYDEVDNWKCASKVIYPVFHALKVTYTTVANEMTFEEARDRCAELGTSLATVDDIRAAMNLGFNICWCGWIAGGGNAVILSYDDPNCIQDFQSVPSWCSLVTANAWCKS